MQIEIEPEAIYRKTNNKEIIMQRENKWQDRFENEFLNFGFECDCEYNCDCWHSPKEKLKSFIQSEIDTAIAEERKNAQEEYKQFILNILDGIDIADGHCNTKAIRHAIKSKLIE